MATLLVLAVLVLSTMAQLPSEGNLVTTNVVKYADDFGIEGRCLELIYLKVVPQTARLHRSQAS